jgi:hypothetical protein
LPLIDVILPTINPPAKSPGGVADPARVEAWDANSNKTSK